MSHIYMIFFILFIGFLIGMFTTALVLHDKGELKPDVLDDVLAIIGEAYDTSQIPPDAYYEIRERVMAMKETSHIKTMDLLQEVSIKRGRREALEEVLEIIEEIRLAIPVCPDTSLAGYETAISHIVRRVKKLMEEQK